MSLDDLTPVFHEDGGTGNFNFIGGTKNVIGVGVVQTDGGIFGSAISFNGINGYYYYDQENLPAPPSPQRAITVAGWFKTNSFTKDKNEITGSWISKRNSYILDPETDGSVKFYAFIEDNWYSASSPPQNIVLNKWQHWVGTYNGGEMKIYLDGKEVGSKTIAGKIAVDNSSLCIGHDCGLQAPHDNRYFDGLADEIMIYDQALSGDSVSLLYQEQKKLLVEEIVSNTGDIVIWNYNTAGDLNNQIVPSLVVKLYSKTDITKSWSGTLEEVPVGSITTFKEMPLGVYTVIMTAPGFTERKGEIEIIKGDNGFLRFSMSKSGAPPAAAPTCTETDAGLDVTKKGTLTCGSVIYEDECHSSGAVKEWFYDSEIQGADWQYVTCLAGKSCKEGWCQDAEKPSAKKSLIPGRSEAEVQCSSVGCFTEGKCFAFGTRANGKYCNQEGLFEQQKIAKDVCENSYECGTNSCLNGKCVDAGVLDRIIAWFSRLV